jgi:hypothetical protein
MNEYVDSLTKLLLEENKALSSAQARTWRGTLYGK